MSDIGQLAARVMCVKYHDEDGNQRQVFCAGLQSISEDAQRYTAMAMESVAEFSKSATEVLQEIEADEPEIYFR